MPADIVTRGVTLRISYAILLTSPLKFPREQERVSVFLQLECSQAKSDSALLHKKVTVRLKHWANSSQATDLQAMNVTCDRRLVPVSGCKKNSDDQSIVFPVDITVNCLCITRKRIDGPVESSYFATLIREPPTRNLQRFWLCVMYAVPSWRDVRFLHNSASITVLCLFAVFISRQAITLEAIAGVLCNYPNHGSHLD